MDRTEEIDYEPFPDKYPELNLVPTTMISCSISNLSGKFDYVQDFNRKGENGRKDNFHLLVNVMVSCTTIVVFGETLTALHFRQNMKK